MSVRTEPAEEAPERRPGERVSQALIVAMAVATGLAVANNYYAQPLLPAIRDDLGLSSSLTSLMVTVGQAGYALGLVLLLPLGDLLERRRLIAGLGLGVAAALALVAAAPTGGVLLAGAVLVGFLAVQAQILVPFAASLAADDERGRVVGTVMSGLLMGILLARTVSGLLAEAGTWRLVFAVAAGAMAVQALLLRTILPRGRAPSDLRYPALLRSVWALVRAEPVLRLRAAYGGISMAAFSVLWTSMAYLLSGPPYGYGTGTIGLFGLVGAAGALAANAAGRQADRGRERVLTAGTVVILAVSWIPLALAPHGVIWLVVGILLLDVAVQGLHITNQAQIYALAPQARSRVNSAYMTSYFIGGAAGSAASAVAWSIDGWSGVAVVGGAVSLAAVGVWALARARGWRAAAN